MALLDYHPLKVGRESIAGLNSVTLGLTGFVLLVSVYLFLESWMAKGRFGPIRNSQGEPIKELKGNSRVLKFASSVELSNVGKELAGDKPYIIHNGRVKELVVVKPNHIQDFYKNDTKDHPKPRGLNMGEYFNRILGDAVGVQAGERWKVIRKYFDPEFAHGISMQALSKFSSLIHTWADELQTTLMEQKASCDNGETHEFTVDLTKSLRFLPFKLVAFQMYGEAFTEDLYNELLEINKIHEQILHDVILNNSLVSKLGNWIPSPPKKRMDLYLNRWKGFNLDIIQRAREFLHTLDEILFANVDISSAVLSTLFSRLAANLAIQDALRDEISQWTGSTTQYISKQDTLLNCAIMESMRLTPAFAFSLPECTAAAKTIGGYTIPPNMPVVIDAQRLNTDSATWGEDSRLFRPERFRALSSSQCRYSFLRFGVGGASGKCMGRNVADLIFKLAVMIILQRYRLISGRDDSTEKQGPSVSTDIRFVRI
ncbi:hypothetical protein N7475_007232 [Penicillium sp. IBT 31633x]|nr:hypothetical protein N7475_007232 [Penicillium sp. IBT 31633x]